jgi:beta-N-acetylhexosaminidase
VEVRETGTTPTQAVVDQAVAASAGTDLVVVTTMNAGAVDAATGRPTASAAAQQALVAALVATGRPVVVAGVRNPYDVAWLPTAPTYLATYGYTAAQLEALTRVVFGEIAPRGRLPVSVPRADGGGVLYPLGHGLGFGG